MKYIWLHILSVKHMIYDEHHDYKQTGTMTHIQNKQYTHNTSLFVMTHSQHHNNLIVICDVHEVMYNIAQMHTYANE